MTELDEYITVREVVFTIIPRLKSTEQMMVRMLNGRIKRCADPLAIKRLSNAILELELETRMIRMNIEHFLTRHSDQLEEALNTAGGGDKMLALDEHEIVALRGAQQLFERAQGLPEE